MIKVGLQGHEHDGQMFPHAYINLLYNYGKICVFLFLSKANVQQVWQLNWQKTKMSKTIYFRYIWLIRAYRTTRHRLHPNQIYWKFDTYVTSMGLHSMSLYNIYPDGSVYRVSYGCKTNYSHPIHVPIIWQIKGDITQIICHLLYTFCSRISLSPVSNSYIQSALSDSLDIISYLLQEI